MKVSLIVGTVGREIELERLLDSLAVQSLLPHEVFVVDQNEDDRLVGVIRRFQAKLPLIWLRTASRGLSQARNLALRQVTGDWVGFPDDDCEYPPRLLEQVAALIPRVDAGGLIVGDTHGRSRWPGYLGRYSIWWVGVSYRIFLRHEAVSLVGEFDPLLGVGAGTPFGSGEESDYLIRCLQKGVRLYFYPPLQVGHPAVDFAAAGAQEKAYRYALGRRQVLRRHNYPLWFRLADGLWPLLRMLTGWTTPGKARYCWQQFRGRIGAGGLAP